MHITKVAHKPVANALRVRYKFEAKARHLYKSNIALLWLLTCGTAWLLANKNFISA